MKTNLLAALPRIRSLIRVASLHLPSQLVDVAFVIALRGGAETARHRLPSTRHPGSWRPTAASRRSGGSAIQAGAGHLASWRWRGNSRRPIWAGWAALFLAALADDQMRLHENKGAWLAEKLRFPRVCWGCARTISARCSSGGCWPSLPLAVPRFSSSVAATDGPAGPPSGWRSWSPPTSSSAASSIRSTCSSSAAGWRTPWAPLEDGGELVALQPLCLSYVVALHRRLRRGPTVAVRSGRPCRNPRAHRRLTSPGRPPRSASRRARPSA